MSLVTSSSFLSQDLGKKTGSGYLPRTCSTIILLSPIPAIKYYTFSFCISELPSVATILTRPSVSCPGSHFQNSKCRAHVSQLSPSLSMTDIDNQAWISCQLSQSSNAASESFLTSYLSSHLLLPIKCNEQLKLNPFAIPVATQSKMQLQAEFRIKNRELFEI